MSLFLGATIIFFSPVRIGQSAIESKGMFWWDRHRELLFSLLNWLVTQFIHELDFGERERLSVCRQQRDLWREVVLRPSRPDDSDNVTITIVVSAIACSTHSFWNNLFRTYDFIEQVPFACSLFSVWQSVRVHIKIVASRLLDSYLQPIVRKPVLDKHSKPKTLNQHLRCLLCVLWSFMNMLQE